MSAKPSLKLHTSLMERLVDVAPFEHDTPQRGEFVDVTGYLAQIRTDLESLLNTRHHFPDDDIERYPNVAESVATYGLRDLSRASSRNQADRETIRREIERAVKVFDRRLNNVKVSLDDSLAQSQRRLVFRVDAIVDLKPAKGRVVFDASLDLATNEYQIVESFGS